MPVLEPTRETRPEQRPSEPSRPAVASGGEGGQPVLSPRPEPSFLGPGKGSGGGMAGLRPASSGGTTGPARTEWTDVLLAKYKRQLLLFGAVALLALLVVAAPTYRSQKLADELMLEKSQIQKQLPTKLTRSVTLTGVQASATSLTLFHVMDVPKENIVFSALEQDVRNDVCGSDRKEKIKSGASYNFEYRDSLRERIGRVEISSCP
jgi:hypothetical protein